MLFTFVAVCAMVEVQVKTIWKERYGRLSHITWCREKQNNLYLKWKLQGGGGCQNTPWNRKSKGVCGGGVII